MPVNSNSREEKVKQGHLVCKLELDVTNNRHHKRMLAFIFITHVTIHCIPGSYNNPTISVVAAILEPQQAISTEYSNSIATEQRDVSPSSSEANPTESLVKTSGAQVHPGDKLKIMPDDIDNKVTTTSTEDDTTTIGIVVESLQDSDNYLETGLVDAHLSQSPDFMLARLEGPEVSDINTIASKIAPLNLKFRREAVPSQSSSTDWWMRIAPKQASKKSEPKATTLSKQHPEPERPRRRPTDDSSRKGDHGELEPTKSTQGATVYREQPLNQNALITIRNQLAAIRGKHKLLITRSMRQLQQLDQKLIDSYKLCLKKKMPLYAGLLYRTRDFVVKMAKEAKHERKVLEAMTKQVQGVLRQKMSNRTLVREYNRLMATDSTEPSRQSGSLEESNVYQKVQSTKIFSTRIKKESDSLQQQLESDVIPQVSEAVVLGSTVAPHATIATNKKPWRGTRWPISRGKNDVQTKLGHNSTPRLSPTAKEQNYGKGTKHGGQEREVETATKADKPVKYVVNVNEVKLKKELRKIQALIDRINGSCYELTAVVDDITYLFKLTNQDSLQRKNHTVSGKASKIDKVSGQQLAETNGPQYLIIDQKRAKKMFRSPIRVFLEKYGRLTMPTTIENNSDNSTSSNGSTGPTNYSAMDLAETKPLFEPSSLIYSEPTDPDLGFDPATPGSE